MEKESVINKTIKDFSKQTNIIQTILIFLIALLVPTFLGMILNSIFGKTSIISTNSQIVVGSIVNTALIISALNLKGIWKLAGVITMPSISTILSGYIFKTASTYMVWMIPAIWIGNFALVYAYKVLVVSKEKNYFITGVIGVIVKVAIIFGCFSILRIFNVFPDKLVANLQVAMGTTQAITATIGVILSFFIYKIEKTKIGE